MTDFHGMVSTILLDVRNRLHLLCIYDRTTSFSQVYFAEYAVYSWFNTWDSNVHDIEVNVQDYVYQLPVSLCSETRGKTKSGKI